MAPLCPTADPVARFRASLAALGAVRLPIAVAYSGGPDSLALLLLAAQAFPGKVRAATVDHGLRTDSAAEAELAASNCGRLGVPHAILRVTVQAGASPQAFAREARYRALASWMQETDITTILTAHHLDDQAETLVMRLLRGSGVAGLAGIRARRPLAPESGAEVLRPLLGWRRSELAEIATAWGMPVALDPSNEDGAFDRVRVRRLLAQAPWLDPAPLARSAAALADAEDALQALAASSLPSAVDPRDGHIHFRPSALPREIRRRLLLECIRRYSPGAAPRGEQLSDVLAALEQGRDATLAGVMLKPLEDGWRIEPAPPRRLAQDHQPV
jgi:tRNA(Ile)-lysidine synthase